MTKFQTRISTERLKKNAEALGFDANDSAALAVCAMVSDPAFREQVTRFYFDRAVAAIKAGAK
jgi:hypothetical protein